MILEGIFGNYHRRLLPVVGIIEPLLLAGSVYAGVFIRFGDMSAASVDELLPIWPKALTFSLIGMACLVAVGLYNQRLRDGIHGVLVRLAIALVFASALMMNLFYMFPSLLLGRIVFALSMFVAFIALGGLRAGYLRLLREGNNRRRVLVVGSGKRASQILSFRRATDFIGVNFVGFVRMPGDAAVVPASRCVVLDQPLVLYAARHHVDQVVIAVDDRRKGLPMEQLLECRTHGVDVVELATLIEQDLGLLKLDALDAEWLIFSPGFNRRLLRRWVKRLFDIAASILLLVVALPVMAITALAICLEAAGRGPVLYRQMRIGEQGIPFELLKFRSMEVNAEGDGKPRWASSQDRRITRVGGFIRKYRFDELPQIFHVLSGKMSFVGPRPERPQFVSTLSSRFPYYSERHRVKPGLTGWAQVRYPYGSSERDAFEKLQFDLYYAKNHSLLFDVTILLQTVEVVLWGKGSR
ncbi:MAG: TIGR03013 family PEP-CTERM/XrtA system glycosyltransferase [Nitrococcus sp.]|nr:TIGR03013 family PEP-CTERM/XrtA system glycosyltransferase [Nitrococcus sp.]